jgi:mono/diheme cytochrome c family protein
LYSHLRVPAWFAMAAGLLQAQASVSFVKDIKPILETRCLKCHGGTMQAAKLDLRSREAALKGSEKGPVIIAHKPEESSLYKKISGAEKPLMPMDGRLPDAQIAAIRQWIEQGAAWDAALDGGTVKQDLAALEQWKVPDGAREWWAFKKPVKVAVPKTGDAEWDTHPIDAFLHLTHQKMKLKPAPVASKASLLRRAFLDLTGLPPTAGETLQFMQDQ